MDVFQALSDPVRRQIVGDLFDGQERSLTELAEGHHISRQAVTKHLNALSVAGIVECRTQGKLRLHRLNPVPLKEVADWLEPYAALWDQRLAALQQFLAAQAQEDTHMNHDTRAIERELLLPQPIAQVWQAITDPKHIGQWFGEVAEFEPKVGAEGWFGWAEHGRFAMRIERLQPMTDFAWRWMAERDVAFATERSTLVEWRLQAESATSTRLFLRESGFKTPQSRQENVGGWAEELGHLSGFLSGQ